MKTEDPYKALVAMHKRIAQGAALQPTIGIGVVVTPPPSIVIRYNGYDLDASRLYVDDYWIPGHTRHMVGETSNASGGSGEQAYASHNHPIDNDETWTDTLRPGTLVAVIPVGGQENQLYIIADSLVKL